MRINDLILNKKSTPLALTGLKQINLILGPANIGKSYVLDGIYREIKKLSKKDNSSVVYLKDTTDFTRAFDKMFLGSKTTKSIIGDKVINDKLYAEKLINAVKFFFKDYTTKDISNPLEDWEYMSTSFKKLVYLSSISSLTTFDTELLPDIVIVDDLDSCINHEHFKPLARLLFDSRDIQFFVVIKNIELLDLFLDEINRVMFSGCEEDIVVGYKLFTKENKQICSGKYTQQDIHFNICHDNELRS